MDYQILNLLFRCNKEFSHEKIRKQDLSDAAEHHYVQPSNFLGVGGMKIFRDLADAGHDCPV